MSGRSVILVVEDKLSEAVSTKILGGLGIDISQSLGLKRIFPEDFGERRTMSESYLHSYSICSHYKISL